MVATRRTQSLTDFRQKAAETLERVNRTGEAEIITVNGEAKAVLLSPDVYDELEREAAAVAMRKSIKHLNAGESQDLHAAMDEIRTELLEMKAARGNKSRR